MTPNTSIQYLAADLFCTLEEAAQTGGLRGRLALALYGFMFPAGRLLVGEELMFNIRLKGRKVLEEL
ncbi:MAG: hypothetical protein PHD55_05435 [Methanoregula sp.]|nr:hypothetical protein [Methanoregula sp.]